MCTMMGHEMGAGWRKSPVNEGGFGCKWCAMQVGIPYIAFLKTFDTTNGMTFVTNPLQNAL